MKFLIYYIPTDQIFFKGNFSKSLTNGYAKIITANAARNRLLKSHGKAWNLNRDELIVIDSDSLKLFRNQRKKTAKKKITHKKNPRTYRKSSGSGTHKQLSLFLIFICKGKTVHFLLIKSNGEYGWSGDKNKAIRIKTKKQASGIAKNISKRRGYASYQVGVVNESTTAAQIRSACTAGKA